MRVLAVMASLLGAVPGMLLGQDDTSAVRALAWQSAGAKTIELDLAGPAGGAIADVFFSSDGTRLFARTERGDTWVTEDLGDTWRRLDSRIEPARPAERAEGAALPPGESSAAVFRHAYDSRYLFALGDNLHRSTDVGRTWVNLTGDALGSIIGDGQRAIAFSPLDPDLLVVANSRGLWRSVDGGLSWTSLNLNLPNLPPARIGRPSEGAARVFLRDVGPVEWNSAGVWQPVRDPSAEAWVRAIGSLPAADQHRVSPWPLDMPPGWAASFRMWREGQPISPDLASEGHFISAFAGGGYPQPRYYAGASDGHLWVSADGGRTWQQPQQGFNPGARPVASLWVDARNPFVAVAVLGGRGGPHVFRTTNGGLFWDDLTANLPDVGVHAVAANAESGSLYVATDAGVFQTRADLRNPGPANRWTRLAGNLPAAPIEDLRLDPVSGTLYVVAAGYGLYRTTVPDVTDALRVLNAADLTARAAAPGGLLTVLGASVRAARADQRDAPVLASTPTESQIQVPFEATGPTLNLALETQRGLRRLGLPLEAVSPAIFLDADGSPLVLDAAAGVLLDANRPARAGSQILILATGLGRVRPEWPTGLPAPLDDPPVTVAPVAAYLNGAPLRVLSSTLAGGYIGVYMVRAELPAIVNSGTGEITLVAGDKSSNRVKICLDPAQ